MTTDPPLEDLARDWLAAERAEATGYAQSDERSRATSAAYEAAIRAATREDLLLAWHAAIGRQDDTEMGSDDWANAREVSELLRFEYEATEDGSEAAPGPAANDEWTATTPGAPATR
jgi:hypothetical protein